MKMFNITKAKGVKSEYFHTDLIDFFPKLHCSKIPMFQKSRTHSNSITVLFPICLFVYALVLRYY